MPSDGLNVAGDAAAPAPENFNTDDVLGFDPFRPKDPPSEPASAGEGIRSPEGSKGQQGDGQVPPTDADSGQTPQQPAEGQNAPSDQPDKVAETLAAIRQMLEQQRTVPKQPQAPQPQAPKFNLEVPAQVQTLMMSEDAAERQQGFNVLVSGLANAVWTEVEQTVNALRQEFRTTVPQTIQQHLTVEEQQREMKREFYSEYPSLQKTPVLQDLVVRTSQALVQQDHARGVPFQWNQEFRDRVAKAVYEGLGLQAPAPVRGQQRAAPQPARPQPFVAGRSNRQAGPNLSDDQKDILETLGLPV